MLVGRGSQQLGQRRVIRELFEAYRDSVKSDQLTLLPVQFRERLTSVRESTLSDNAKREEQIRKAADLVASMTEAQALEMHGRITGARPGSLVDTVML